MNLSEIKTINSKHNSPHPIVYLFLILPFGVMSGYLIIAIAYELSKAGFSLTSIAELIAISYIPHTWKFLWAPAADITLTRKKWYIITAFISSVGIMITGAIPPEIKYFGLFSAVILISNLAVTFVSMSTESIIVIVHLKMIKDGHQDGFRQEILAVRALEAVLDYGWNRIFQLIGYRVLYLD